VLLWVSRGKSNREIGDILDISPRTVNKHMEQIFVKLGFENRASAAAGPWAASVRGGTCYAPSDLTPASSPGRSPWLDKSPRR
jgi:hypothetical protein